MPRYKALSTAPAVGTLSAAATLQADGSIKITWSKYTGEWFNYYGIQRAKDGGAPAPVMA